VVAFVLAGSLPLAAVALQPLDDSQMAQVSGTGIALGLANFRFAMAPTSYIELTGTNTSIPAGWSRADARYYGLSFTAVPPASTTSGTGSTDWFGNGCTSTGADSLNCPMGTGSITYFAPVFDPYVLRAYQETGYDYQGASKSPTVLELLSPKNPDTWMWAFWGEIEVGRNGASPAPVGTCNNSDAGCVGGADFLQSESIIQGKPVTKDGTQSIMYLVKTLNNNDSTLGLIYQSHLSGNFRFSVQQHGDSSDTLHMVPDFFENEGLYFKNVDAYMPLGELNYQTLNVNDTSAHDGNFSLELTLIPNVNAPACAPSCGDGQLDGNGTNGAADGAATPNNVGSYNNATNYNGFYQAGALSSGYVCWGAPTSGTCAAANSSFSESLVNKTVTGTNATQGIYFENSAGTVTNIGTGMITGMRIQHLQITSLGAG
jgi:hypothetical protein